MDLTELPLDHVAIAVPSIATVLPLFEALTGSKGSAPERVDTQGVELVFVGSGPGRLELIEPLSAESPVARFLERRGPGLHHIAYLVPSLEPALERLAAAGIQPIAEPRQGAHGRRVVFMHPKTAGGVLVELVEAAAG
jgi:methylmalonyl-CoA/ethylmalonyl-CoA epimerase